MVEQAVANYIGEVNYDNALPREVGIDKEGDYYFYLEGIITEDPDGNWDYDEYATGDMPYFKLPLNNNGEYDEIEKLCDITSSQSMILLNNKSYLFGSGGVEDLVEKYTFDAEYEEVSHEFLKMVIEERDPTGMFYTQVENGNYVGVDNLKGEAWTEEFVHFKTLERWLTDGSFSYFTETDKEKYTELDSALYMLTELEEQNERYREALEFYADEDNYTDNSKIISTVEFDKGARARKALNND